MALPTRVVHDPGAQQNFEHLDSLLGAAVFDTGDLKASALATPPPGWLLCDGTALTSSHPAQTLRSKLIADGSPHGVSGGDPKLPDLRGCVPMGAGTGPGLTARGLGDRVGEEAHLLLAGESGLPDHTHPSAVSPSESPTWQASNVATGVFVSQVTNAGTGGVAGGARNAAAAHNNMQPSVAINWLIRM